MFKRNKNAIIYLVKAMDIANIIMGILAIVFTVFVIAKVDEHTYAIPHVVVLVAIIDLFMSFKQFLKEEYQAFLLRLILGIIFMIIGIILEIAL